LPDVLGLLSLIVMSPDITDARRLIPPT
jgi:hypothetical protein